MFLPDIWEIEPAQVEEAERLISHYESEDLFQQRLQKNVDREGLELSKEDYWEKLIGCVITTQQRSGPGTNVHTFMQSEEFPLQLSNWPEEDQVSFAQDTLVDHGIPGQKKGEYIAQNYGWFRTGGADFLMQIGEDLIQAQSDSSKIQIFREAQAALAIQPFFKGIGPKQSRNFWQWLGVTQYEIPIDSRILSWIQTMPSTPPAVKVEQNDLQDEQTYRILLSWIQAISKEAGVLPCLLDAAVFLSQQNRETG